MPEHASSILEHVLCCLQARMLQACSSMLQAYQNMLQYICEQYLEEGVKEGEKSCLIVHDVKLELALQFILLCLVVDDPIGILKRGWTCLS